MKLLYLYSAYKADRLERAKRGEFSDNQFLGLLRLPRVGIQTGYVEIEQYLPLPVCRFLRRWFGIYFAHVPVFWRLFSYDVVFHTNSFITQFFFISLGFKKPKWVLYDYSLTGLLGGMTTLKQKILRFIIKRSAGVITISKEEAQRLKRLFPTLKDSIEFIPYGTDIKYFAPRAVPQVNQVLAVGFDPGRDYPTLFKATEGLGARVLITKSHRSTRLPAVLPPHVEARRFSEEELLDAYAKSKIVVVPLDIRGGANDAMGVSTIVEAMAMGKAVVASCTFTTESYITDGENGLLVPERDAGALRRAIKRLLEDDALRASLGARAREFIEEECNADLAAKRMANYFQRINQH